MRFRPRHLFFLLTLLWTGAHAQTTPGAIDAGSLRQQIDQQRELTLPPAVRSQPTLPPALKKSPDGAGVKVKTFQFKGNTLLSDQQLAPAVAEFVGRELSFEDLQLAADAISSVYRQAGFIVRAYLPEQDVTEQVVTVQVIEAQFAGVRLEGDSPKLVNTADIKAYFAAAQAVGKVLRADNLDRALLLVDDLPGVSLAGTFAPGETDGDTVLVVQATDEPFVYGNVGLDNAGTRSTGTRRVTAGLNVNSPGQRGELLSLNAMFTEGIDYGRVALTVPDGHNGLRLSANMSSMNYKVIQGTGLDAQVKGSSKSIGADLNYPILRARMSNLYWSLGLENKSFYTSDLTAIRSDYESVSLRTGLSGNLFDDLGGGGANTASAQMLRGRLASMTQHASLGKIDPNYSKINYSFSRQQSLMESHTLLLSLQGQHATQVLDSSEKIYAGGAQSVRAYPSSESGGERGQLLSAEWRWRLNTAVVVTAFVDHSRLVSLPLTSSDQKTTNKLSGRGLSVDWQAPMGVVTKLTWSHRNGANPQPNVNTGADSDGTLKLNRFWLSVSKSF